MEYPMGEERVLKGHPMWEEDEEGRVRNNVFIMTRQMSSQCKI